MQDCKLFQWRISPTSLDCFLVCRTTNWVGIIPVFLPGSVSKPLFTIQWSAAMFSLVFYVQRMEGAMLPGYSPVNPSNHYAWQNVFPNVIRYHVTSLTFTGCNFPESKLTRMLLCTASQIGMNSQLSMSFMFCHCLQWDVGNISSISFMSNLQYRFAIYPATESFGTRLYALKSCTRLVFNINYRCLRFCFDSLTFHFCNFLAIYRDSVFAESWLCFHAMDCSWNVFNSSQSH